MLYDYPGMFLFSSELVDTIEVSLYRGRNDICIGTEAIVDVSVVLHLHVHLTYIVGALRDSLDGELLQCHGLMDDTLQAASTGPFPVALSSNF